MTAIAPKWTVSTVLNKVAPLSAVVAASVLSKVDNAVESARAVTAVWISVRTHVTANRMTLYANKYAAIA